MPNLKISQFQINTNPSGENLLAVVASGITKAIPLSGVSSFVLQNVNNITGATFSNNNLLLINNTGGTISTNVNNFTGLTVSGSLSATTYYGNGSGLTYVVSASTNSTSKYLFSSNTLNQIYFNGTKMRDISTNTPIQMFKLEHGGIFDGINPIIKNGAMTSAVISKQGDFDRISVIGGDSTSYFQLDKQSTLNQFSITLKVKINSIGSSPLIGFTGIWPGLTYSNFNNSQYFAYVSLLNGNMTTQTGGNNTSYNGFLSGVTTGDTIELTLTGDYLVGQTLTMKKLTGFVGEVSQIQTLKNTSSNGWVYHNIPAVIMADGDYTILDYSAVHTDTFKPKICLIGDSMSSGIGIVKADSVVGKFKSKIPYRASSLGAGSCLLKGTLATIYETLNILPEYLVLFFYLDPIFYGKANSGNTDYSTFTTDLSRFLGIIKQAGIKPIFVYPETWAVLDPSGTKCAVWEAYLNATYPSERKVKVLTSESFYDFTGFHYIGTTNEIIVNKVIALLESEGTL